MTPSHTAPPPAGPESALDTNADRDAIGRFFCEGAGVEIGAGSRPTAVGPGASVRYADKRSDEELRAYFSADDVVHVESLASLGEERFDFLIAHHVLEHCANVVETLVEWMRLVRDGGVLFLSLPNRDTTPDNLRLRTPPTHFLFDYLLRTTEDDFESREHIAGFLWSWFDVGGLQDKTKREAALLVTQAVHSERNDLHWHTFTLETAKFCVAAAAAVSGRVADLSFQQDGHARRDEHRMVFRLRARPAEDAATARLRALREELRDAADAYALTLLEGSIVHSLSAAHRRPMLVENGRLRPIRGAHAPVFAAPREPTYFEPREGLLGAEVEGLAEPGPSLADHFAARIAAAGGAKGVRIGYAAATPTVTVETYADPRLPAVEGVVFDLASAFAAGDVYDRLLAALPAGALDFVVLDGIAGAAPDLVRLLRIATAALAPGGTLLLAVDDNRHARGARRPDSDVGDAIAAFEAARTAPSHRMRIAHYAALDADAPSAPMAALRMAARPSADAAVACFVFTPDSMRRMLASLSGARLLAIGGVDVSEGTPHPNAFVVEITAPTPPSDQMPPLSPT